MITVNTYANIFTFKLKSILGKISLSSTIINSEIDRTSAIRQRCRVYYCKIGKYSYIARNTLVQNTEIGNYCSISEKCNIGMPSHPTTMVSTSPVFLKGNNYLKKNYALNKYDDCPRTFIGNDVWIGSGAMIKSGIIIGNGAVIAAGAIVTHNIPPFAIVGGVPAKLIRFRFAKDEIVSLQNISWWNWNEEKLQKYAKEFASVDKFIAVTQNYPCIELNDAL